MPNQTLHPEEQEAKQFIEGLNLTVHPIPTPTLPSKKSPKSPDFLVDGDARDYVLEVKTRFDSEEWSQTIAKGEPAIREQRMSYGRWSEDVAHYALKQFPMADPWHLRWWVLWFIIRTRVSADTTLDEVIGSLFGVRQVVYSDPSSKKQPMRDCLFARPGVFERHPEIVASIIDLGNSLSFCVNEFAPDFTSFQKSVIYSTFDQLHPPISTTDLTANRGFFQVTNRSLDRKNDKTIASYLEQRYGLKKPTVIDMKVHSASVFVPTKN